MSGFPSSGNLSSSGAAAPSNIPVTATTPTSILTLNFPTTGVYLAFANVLVLGGGTAGAIDIYWQIGTALATVTAGSIISGHFPVTTPLEVNLVSLINVTQTGTISIYCEANQACTVEANSQVNAFAGATSAGAVFL